MMRRALVLALAVTWLAGASAWAKKAPKDDGGTDDDTTTVSDDDQSDKPDKDKDKNKADKADTDSDDKSTTDDNSGADDKPKGSNDNEDFKKQDLTGHDLGTNKRENEFEKDRFFVDKIDTPKTEHGTLIQGSLAETSFLYNESGGDLVKGVGSGGEDASNLSRLYTELRYQSDFRHIQNSKWDARIDARVRAVDQPTDAFYPTPPAAGSPGSTPLATQSGLLGGNEYDLRELWIVRNGDRSDVFVGRQYITDLAAVKIDGVRVDYASSNKFTLLGFAGLYPLRGSRSITTDYQTLETVNPNGTITKDGAFTGAAGGGAAYRTVNTYGAFGGVVLAPFEGEQPRIFGTSNGYWRYGSTLDFYHFAVIDLIGSNTVNTGLTNLSAGVNYKPNPRLRLTGSFNRVDTETLNVQAGSFLSSVDTQHTILDNEVFIARIATNEARGSVSAGLGELQRFELTTSLTYRYRPDLTISSIGTATPMTATLKAEEGVEFYASITDRHSIKGARLQADVIRTFGVGGISYAHTDLFGVRFSGSHEFKDGQGEVEAEVAYSTTRDNDANGMGCQLINLDTCFGTTASSLLSVGGTVYYRLNRDWFGITSLFVTKESVTTDEGVLGSNGADAPITGVTGFLRVAYRF